MVWVVELLRNEIEEHKNNQVCDWVRIKEQNRVKLERRQQTPIIEKYCNFCNELAGLEIGKCLLCTEKLYRLVYSVTPERSIMIAKGENIEEMESHWEYLETGLLPMLESFTQEETKKHAMKDRKLEIFSKIKLIRQSQDSIETSAISQINKDILSFLLLKISALVKEQEREYMKAIEDSSFFQKAFNSRNISEPVEYKEVVTCWRNSYSVGVLFLTKNFFCFSANFGDRTICIPYSLIVTIKLGDSFPFFEDAIIVSLKTTREICLLDMENANLTHNILLSYWKKAVKMCIDIQNQTIEKASENFFANDMVCKSSSMTKLEYTRKKAKDIYKSPESKVVKTRKSLSSVPTFKTFFQNTSSQSEFIKPIFANPCTSVLQEETCYFNRSSRKIGLVKGVIQISYKALYFCTLEDNYSVTLPFSDVKSIDRVKTELHTLTISLLSSYGKDIYLEFRCEEAINLILQLFNSRENKPFLFDLNWTKEEKTQWKRKQKFFAQKNFFHPVEQDKLQAKWNQYFRHFGYGSTIIKTERLCDLVLDGIPNKLRPMMWQIISGSYYFRVNEPIKYHDYLKQAAEALLVNATAPTEQSKEQIHYFNEIEKDLTRSLPEHPYYGEGDVGIASLRNVLRAFATKNSEIGYCQGMNIICALLLLFMPEEDAFFLFSTIVEDLLPDYFTKSMLGSLIDLKLMEDLVNEFLPQIANHFNKSMHSETVASATVCWFMCLYVHCIPWDATLRAIDLFLTEGSRALFILALATFKVCEKLILASDSNYLLEILKVELPDNLNTQELFKFVKYFSKLISIDRIMELREYYTPLVLDEIESYAAVTDAPDPPKPAEKVPTSNPTEPPAPVNIPAIPTLVEPPPISPLANGYFTASDYSSDDCEFLSGGEDSKDLRLVPRGRKKKHRRTRSNTNTPNIRDRILIENLSESDLSKKEEPKKAPLASMQKFMALRLSESMEKEKPAHTSPPLMRKSKNESVSQNQPAVHGSLLSIDLKLLSTSPPSFSSLSPRSPATNKSSPRRVRASPRSPRARGSPRPKSPRRGREGRRPSLPPVSDEE